MLIRSFLTTLPTAHPKRFSDAVSGVGHGSSCCLPASLISREAASVIVRSC